MSRKKDKELVCNVTVTEGFSDRLTKALVDIYYQRKKRAELEGKTMEEMMHDDEKTA